MGVIEPDDHQATVACLALDLDQVTRIDPIAGSGGLSARIAATHHFAYKMVPPGDMPQEHSATLIRIRGFAVSAYLIEVALG